jgi:protein-L-isoaspartate(D-aspartate) O-methyltransferase
MKGVNPLDYSKLRELMVARQIKARGIFDERVLSAMLTVERHLFVSESLKNMAYEDMPLAIGSGQTISQPYMAAVMTQMLSLGAGRRVLEIGTGSGYQAAVLSRIAKEVYTVERIAELSTNAEARFSALGYDNIHTKVADGTEGWPEKAPFDGIIVTAAAPEVPRALADQLCDGGVLVAPVGERYSQELVRVVKHGDKIEREYSVACVFVPLIGRYGWKE